MKWFILLFISIPLLAASLNAPNTAIVDASTGSVTYIPVCDTVSGNCLTSLTNGGKLWSHLGVQNQSTSDFSFTTLAGNNPSTPSSTTTAKYYVYAYGNNAWDDIAIFNNLYFQFEGSTLATGQIVVTVW